MPGPKAIVDPELCRPALCPGGRCLALGECKLKVLKQEAPNEVPYADFTLCRGCMKCFSACPVKAIRKVV